jgi:hypothetical protein
LSFVATSFPSTPWLEVSRYSETQAIWMHAPPSGAQIPQLALQQYMPAPQ